MVAVDIEETKTGSTGILKVQLIGISERLDGAVLRTSGESG